MLGSPYVGGAPRGPMQPAMCKLRHLRAPLGAVMLALLAPAGCGEDPQAEGPPDGISTTSYSLSTIDCTESTGTGYVSGSPFTITLVTVDGKKVEKSTANAYYVMAQAASAAGVNLKVVSGFRTMSEQTYFYNCYINCNCNSCNLAAKPGYSNHQSGHAADLNTAASGVYSWLSSHAASYGWKRTVSSEPWHWEWWGGGPGGGPCVTTPTWPLVTIKTSAVTIAGQERDLCQLGQSKGIFDLQKGQKVEVHVDVKNSGTAVGKNVTVGLWCKEPQLEISKWNILSDWKNNGSFVTNDSDSMQSIGHNDPGQTFSLKLYSLSPGETKRVKLEVEAGAFTLDHAEVRGWVSHIDSFYDKTSYGSTPNNVKSYQKQNGGDLRAALQVDVLDQETCDSKDNDCDGQVDESCSPGAETGPDLGVPEGGPALEADLQPQGGDRVQSGDGAGEGSGADGCALGRGSPPASPTALVLLALLALVEAGRRRRRRR